jgi:GTP-binding protein HflX
MKPRTDLSSFALEREEGVSRGARALVVYPDRQGPRSATRDADSRLDEATGLAAAIGIDVVDRVSIKVRDPRPSTLFGSGQVETIAARGRAADAELTIVDGKLTPVQQRNLETETKTKVIDRTGLILEIFGERAASAEGRLQVELAHLDYQAGRLVRSWTHLERQRGGFGFLGGPGETQIEADRRLIRDRMAKLKRELDQVVRTRGLHRDRRRRAPWPVVALVGYTNAGKSTLFNRMTGATVMAEDLLFATLDPTMREVSLPGVSKAILSDTVGFVSDLPTQLVAAFRATLEEVTSADLIIHVRDIAHPDSEAQAADVESVLTDLGVLGTAGSTPMIEAWNKIDLLGYEAREFVTNEAARRDDVFMLSAVSGEGIGMLSTNASSILTAARNPHTLLIPANDGSTLAWLHSHGSVESQTGEGDALRVVVRLTAADFARYSAR